MVDYVFSGSIAGCFYPGDTPFGGLVEIGFWARWRRIGRVMCWRWPVVVGWVGRILAAYPALGSFRAGFGWGGRVFWVVRPGLGVFDYADWEDCMVCCIVLIGRAGGTQH